MVIESSINRESFVVPEFQQCECLRDTRFIQYDERQQVALSGQNCLSGINFMHG